DADEADVFTLGGIPCGEKVVVDFPGREDDAGDLFVLPEDWRGEDFLKLPFGEVFDRGDAKLGAQEALWGHEDERLAEVALHLTAKDVEVLRRGGEVADLDVILCA